MSTDFIMVLRVADGHVAAKRHWCRGGRWQTEDYSAGFEFGARSREVDSIHGLSRVLFAIEPDRQALVIRGGLVGNSRTASGVRRRYLGADAEFSRADHQWLCTDIDGVPAPDWLDWTSQESRLRAVRWAAEKCLPPCFHGMTLHYQWSASAGVKNRAELRLHLWFWLDRPACDPSLRAWLKPYQYVDKALFNPVQPHYTAAPIFEGAADPLDGCRSGLCVGASDVVVLPADVVDLAAWTERERIQRQHEARQRRERLIALRVGRYSPASQDRRDGFVRRILERAVDLITRAAEGNRHATMFAQAFFVGTIAGAGLVDHGTAEAELECAAFSALPEERHREARRTIRDALTRGAASPFDTTKLAESADAYEIARKRWQARNDRYPRSAS